MNNFDLRKYLAENKLLKESEDIYGEIEAAELELYGSDAAALDLDQWLNDLINASDEELMDIDGGYYEIATVLDNVFLHKAEVMDNVRQWAKLQLNPLNEGKLLQEKSSPELTKDEMIYLNAEIENFLNNSLFNSDIVTNDRGDFDPTREERAIKHIIDILHDRVDY